jgi:hypothetical protein
VGRSVSIPSGAVAVFYTEADWADEFEYQGFIDDLRGILPAAYPSLDGADGWLDREDHIILENGHARVTVSEYCGLVAVALVPKTCTDRPEIAKAWCRQVADGFKQALNRAYPGLNRVGVMSNGEAVYRRA